jgi:hypothetical protein
MQVPFVWKVLTGVATVVALLYLRTLPSRSDLSVLAIADTRIPESIQAEHEAIHEALVAATQVSGEVGRAATALAEVLHPHFVREEQIALPPLGLLAPLAARADIPAIDLAESLAMSDSLRQELPRMMEEHVRIRAAVEELRRVARAGRAVQPLQLADDLALHAKTEEEVLYPAAILVADLIRARRSAR